MEENLKELWSKVNSLIDPKTLIDLALTLGNIDSPAGQEAPAGDYLLDWLKESRLRAKKNRPGSRPFLRRRFPSRNGRRFKPAL